MPRVERDRKLARRRKRIKEKKKLHTKALPGPSRETVKKKPEKIAPKVEPQEASKEVTEPSTSEV